MKIKTLLPLALMAMLVSPAFAAPSNNATSTMTLNLEQFINITTSTATLNSQTTFADDYNTITLTTPPVAAFNVITNDPAQKVTLSGKTTTTGGDKDALFKNGDNIGIVFSNTATDQVPSDTDVSNITGGSTPAIADNKNAIAFLITPNITPSTQYGGEVTNTTVEQNKVVYDFKNGVYDCTYTLNANAFAGTFSPHDSYGTYKATLTMTSGTL